MTESKEIDDLSSEELQQELENYWEQLKDGHSITQTSCAEWMRANGHKKFDSQSKISTVRKTGHPIGNKEKFFKLLLEYHQYLEQTAPEKRVKNHQTKGSDDLKYIRDRGKVMKFVSDELAKHSYGNTEKNITIEATGIKLESLLASLRREIGRIDKTSPIQLKMLLLNPNSEGCRLRGLIENKSNLDKSIAFALEKWMNFLKVNSGLNHQIEFELRLCNINPNFYMIKIEESMLVHPYLADRGSEHFFDVFRSKGTHYYRYEKYYKAFKKYYSSEELSESFIWD